MHYVYAYGTYDEVLKYSRIVVESHRKEWPESSEPRKDIVTRFLQLCGKFKKDAYWIIISDALFQFVGSATLGEEDEKHLQLYNLLVAPEYRKCGFANKILNDVKVYASEKKRSVFGYVKEDNKGLINLYQKHGAKKTDALPKKENCICMILS